MFGLLTLGRQSSRFSSCVRSLRQASSASRLLVARSYRNEPIYRFASTETKPSIQQIRTSKIQLKPTKRRRRPIASLYKEQENSLPKVVGMAKCESYDLGGIFEDDHVGSFYQVTYVDDDAEDTLHITQRSQYRINHETKDAFIFNDGVIVAWNFNDEELSQLTDFLYPFEVDSYDAKLIKDETETVAFTYGSGPRIFIQNDVVNLLKQENNNVPSHIDILDRFAISHGMAASVKIAVWEQKFNDYAEPLYETTKFLIQGNIPWKRKESLQKTGEFAALRQSINLDSGLLNTDFYWERDNLERHYNMAKKYFVIDRRLRELNTRLDYCQQFCSIIDDMLTHRHASRLEWLIIWLIVIEVIFDLLHYFDFSPTAVYLVDEKTTEPIHHTNSE